MSTGNTDTQRVSQFWQWWASEGGNHLAAVFDGAAPPEDVVDLISPRVQALDEGLQWEFGPGSSVNESSRHCLTVTAAGDPALRALARRWLRQAPAADETWCFADLRQPASEGVVLTFAGQPVDVADATFVPVIGGSSFDVTIHHPCFADLDEQQCAQLVFLLLDMVLGEEAVETWIGEIGNSVTALTDGVPLTQMPGLVSYMREQCTDEHGDPTWVALEGEQDGYPVFAVARQPLRPMALPLYAVHVEIALPYPDAANEGLPSSESLEQLQAFESQLDGLIYAAGERIASETGSGVRTLHFYVDADSDGPAVLRREAANWPGAQVTVDVDPGWDAVRHLRT